MKRRTLTYRFHNPNPAAVTADYLLDVLMESNQKKVQLAVQTAASACEPSNQTRSEGRPAG